MQWKVGIEVFGHGYVYMCMMKVDTLERAQNIGPRVRSPRAGIYLWGEETSFKK